MSSDNLAESKNVIEMITVAHEFCLFVERIESYPKEEVLVYFQKIIPLLYLKGTLLPHIEVSDDIYLERFVTAETWEIVFNDIRNKLKPNDEYWITENIDDTEAVKASIADNLTDVYQDLKDFVILYSKNTHTAREIAVVECKNYFEIHWGKRLLSALRAIHLILHKNQS
ncbi:MAG: DUF5063 domain-containing protein [Bacteroidota bacterium]|jgi:hypothetical protein